MPVYCGCAGDFALTVHTKVGLCPSPTPASLLAHPGLGLHPCAASSLMTVSW